MSQLMSVLGQSSITIIWCLKQFWRECDLSLFTALLQKCVFYRISCEMAKHAVKSLKEVLIEVRSVGSNLPFNEVLRNMIINLFVSAALEYNPARSCGDKDVNVHGAGYFSEIAVRAGTEYALMDCGSAHGQKRKPDSSDTGSDTDQRSQAVGEEDGRSTHSRESIIDAEGARAGRKKRFSDFPSESSSRTESATIAELKSSIATMRQRHEAELERMQDVITDQKILSTSRSQQLDEISQRMIVLQAASSSHRAQPAAAAMSSSAGVPVAMDDLWLINISTYDSSKQGKLGRSGWGHLERGDWSAHCPHKHLVFFKKTIIHNHDRAQWKAEQEVNSILKRNPHPNIAAVFGAAISEEPWKKGSTETIAGRVDVTEMIYGVNMNEFLSSPDDSVMRTTIDHKEIVTKLKMMSQIVSGLLHVHNLGIVHRDLHPANVMITSNHLASVSGEFSCRHRVDDDRYSYPDGFAHPELRLPQLRSVHNEFLAVNATRGYRLAIVDWNSALSISTNQDPDQTSHKWNNGATDYAELSWRTMIGVSSRSVQGWKTGTNVRHMFVMRDCWSVALMMTDIMRGVPMTLKRDPANEDEVDPKLVQQYMTYCERKLSQRHVNDGYTLPSMTEFLYTQPLDATHWQHGDRFVQQNSSVQGPLQQMMGLGLFREVRTILSLMTTSTWERINIPLDESLTEQPSLEDITLRRESNAKIDDLLRMRPPPDQLLRHLAERLLGAIHQLASVNSDNLPTRVADKLRKNYARDMHRITGDGDCMFASFIQQLRDWVPHPGATCDVGHPCTAICVGVCEPAVPKWRTEGSPLFKIVYPQGLSTEPIDTEQNEQTVMGLRARVADTVRAIFEREDMRGKLQERIEEQAKKKASARARTPSTRSLRSTSELPQDSIFASNTSGVTLASMADDEFPKRLSPHEESMCLAWVNICNDNITPASIDIDLRRRFSWNGDFAEFVMSALCTLFDVRMTIIGGAPLSVDLQDQELGPKNGYKMYVVRETLHYCGTTRRGSGGE